ncbi:MAG: hypothetical protein HUU27_09790 [Phycisphaerae bacterium]|nr:hypothetical protein [Phycisphaerae bacterium]
MASRARSSPPATDIAALGASAYYWAATRQPLYCLVFLLPLVITFEFAALVLRVSMLSSGDLVAVQLLRATLGLFGANAAGLTVTIGQAVGQDMTIPESNLRDGAMLDIINQDGTGVYSLSVTDADAIGNITAAIQDIATERASLGASQSRLELAAKTLQVEYENLGAAISRIRDVDVAEESTQYAKYNILVQSGTAMLAQANQTPQSVLRLLQQ